MLKLVTVIINSNILSLNKYYYYLCYNELNVGDYIFVPFGKKDIKKGALVINIKEVSNHETENFLKKNKFIIEKNEFFFINQDLLKTIQYFSKKYCIGENIFLNSIIKDTNLYYYKDNVIFGINKNYFKLNTKKEKNFFKFLNSISLPIVKKNIKKYGFTDYILNKKINEKALLTEYLPKYIIDNFDENINFIPNYKKKFFNKLSTNIFEYKTYIITNISFIDKLNLYLKYISTMFKSKKSVLIILPEKKNIDYLLKYFVNIINYKNILVFSNYLNSKDILYFWKRIKEEDEPKLILGLQNSILLPINNIGTIMIDEEHHTNYRRRNNIYYNTKEIAYFRAKYNKCNLFLISNTPTIETYFRYKNNLCDLLEYKDKINLNIDISTINMRNENSTRQINNISNKLEYEIIKILNKNKKVILIFSRRGYYTNIECFYCGWKPLCINCNNLLFFDNEKKVFSCKKCNYKLVFFENCKNCKKKFIFSGIGIQKVFKYIKEKITNKLLVINDINKNKQKIENLINSFDYENKYQILLTTSFISKKNGFMNVGLISYLDIDNFLFSNNFRAKEITYQLLLSSINNIYNNKIKLIIQTYYKNEIEKYNFFKINYFKFLDIELKYRKNFNLPPYCNIVELIIFSKNKESLKEFIYIFYKVISEKYKNIEILKPKINNINIKKKIYSYSLILKCRNKNISEKLKDIINNIIYNDINSMNIKDFIYYLKFNP